MKLNERYGFEELVNEAEHLVLDELGRALAAHEDEGWLNENCVLDMAAYALNKVAPMYRVNLLGRLYANTLKDRHAREIRSAVAEAITTVKADYADRDHEPRAEHTPASGGDELPR